MCRRRPGLAGGRDARTAIAVVPFAGVADPALASGAILKQDRAMTAVFATADRRNAALRGRVRLAAADVRVNNNNRNNASLPRAGD
ncbi:hypothetical protein GLA29479_1572 [Lysobacter antibioticus]|nr:hypothetical protein GLA29479_1572 [Lysobacter antibioticus]